MTPFSRNHSIISRKKSLTEQGMDARVYESCRKCYPSTHSAICVPSLTIPYFAMYSSHRERNCHFNPLALLTFPKD